MNSPSFIDADAFTVAEVYTKSECQSLIERAELIGFDVASVQTRSGQEMLTHIRNNDRVNLEDQTLADDMWSRIRAVHPEFDGQRPSGVDTRLRFYRYEPG